MNKRFILQILPHCPQTLMARQQQMELVLIRTMETVVDANDYVKFRWAFAAPFRMENKVPTMFIEFNVSEALGFYAEGGLDLAHGDSVSSEAPTHDKLFY